MLQSCSAVRLAYNQAPELTYWWLDGYVNFSEVQSSRVRADLARLQQWHRHTELPHYAALLQGMEQLAPGPITPEQACHLLAQLRSRLAALLEQAEPAAAAMALSLSAEQLQHLERKYAKNNADYRRDWLLSAPKEQQAKRYQQWLERSERFYGPLDEPQKDVIRQHAAQSSHDPHTSYAERLRRQQDALQTLRRLVAEQATPAQAQAALHAFIERSLNSPNLAYRAYLQTLMQEGCHSVAATHNSTTAAQRAVAAKRLRAYAQDARLLAQETELAAR